MEVGKRELLRTRRASDGSVEWRCSKCLLFKCIDNFVRTDEKRGYVCKACVLTEEARCQNTKAFVLDFLLADTCKPVNVSAWESAVWRHLYKHLDKSKSAKRTVILEGIRAGRRRVLSKYRLQLISLLATTDLKRLDEYFWLAFRPGLLDQQTLRLYAIGVAKFVAILVGLYAQDSRVEDVLFEVRHAAITHEKMATLRQTVYNILEKLQEEYNPLPMHKAAMSLTAVCFPYAYEAALAATGWAVEAWLAVKGLSEETEANKLNRQAAILDFLDDLRHLMMPLAKDVLEADAQERQRRAMKYKTGAIDYDGIDIDD